MQYRNMIEISINNFDNDVFFIGTHIAIIFYYNWTNFIHNGALYY